jgi:hypothetical protein
MVYLEKIYLNSLFLILFDEFSMYLSSQSNH